MGRLNLFVIGWALALAPVCLAQGTYLGPIIAPQVNTTFYAGVFPYVTIQGAAKAACKDGSGTGQVVIDNGTYPLDTPGTVAGCAGVYLSDQREGAFATYTWSGTAYVALNPGTGGGIQGQPGQSGQSGARGLQGPDGPPGPSGPQGQSGQTGQAGSPGLPGQTGQAGSPGLAGATGPSGKQGPSGLQGSQGPSGFQGAPGVQGGPGVQGAPGPSGPAGGMTVAQVADLRLAASPAVVNLFDLNRMVANKLVSSQDGTLADGLNATGFVAVEPGRFITSNAASDQWSAPAGYAFYDVSRAYLSGGVAGAYMPIAVPAGAAYYRQTFTADPNGLMVVSGSKLPGAYLAFGYDDPATAAAKLAAALSTVGTIPGFTAAVAATAYKVALSLLPATLNLFDPARAVPGTFVLVSDGTLGSMGDHSTTGYIPVTAGGQIISSVSSNDLNTSIGFAFYDVNQVFVAGGQASGGSVISVPARAAFYRQSYNTGRQGDLMVVNGSMLPANYTPFLSSVQPGTYVLPNQSGWAGKRLGVFGDSISSLFGNRWQNIVIARNGMTMPFQDARAGRQTKDAFENYQNNPGSGVTTGSAATGGMTTGTTLTQDLAGVDLLIVWLGTNDTGQARSGNLGTPGDAANYGGSYCAAIAFVLESLTAANPHMRIVWVTPYTDQFGNGHGGASGPGETEAVTAALVSTSALYGVPVLNLLTESGINSHNTHTYLLDGLHPNDEGFDHVFGPMIAQFVQRYR